MKNPEPLHLKGVILDCAVDLTINDGEIKTVYVV